MEIIQSHNDDCDESGMMGGKFGWCIIIMGIETVKFFCLQRAELEIFVWRNSILSVDYVTLQVTQKVSFVQLLGHFRSSVHEVEFLSFSLLIV